MTQILLIRHARNDWVGDRLAGLTPGVHLNAQGRADAAALAARLAEHPLDAVYASPLERTVETAAFIARPHGLTVSLLPGVIEVDFGTWTGQSLEALRKEPLWAGVQFHPSAARFPDGETVRGAQSRAVDAIEGLRQVHPDGRVAVVSHADIIRLVLAHYVGAHLDHFQRILIAPTSVSVIQLLPDRPFVVSMNDTGTLPPPQPSEARPDAPSDVSAAPGADQPSPVALATAPIAE